MRIPSTVTVAPTVVTVAAIVVTMTVMSVVAVVCKGVTDKSSGGDTYQRDARID
jgi:hypothetical protein